MKFSFLPIAPAAILLLAGLTTIGCSPTANNTAEKPLVKPPETGVAPVSSSAPVITESSPAEAPPKPVSARSLTTPEKPLKEKTREERSGDSNPKPVANRALLFSCMTNEGQEILLFETDDTIDYSFGDPGTPPELDLKVSRDRASTWQWKGVGRAMSYAVDVPNGDTSYSVFWSVDRLSETKAVEAGVRVHRDRKTLATIYCTDKIVSNLQGVKLKSTEY